MMKPISIFIAICLAITFLLTLGVISFLGDSEDNKCAMTYMFEYPQFVRIAMKLDYLYPKYGLYAYSEGRFTNRVRKMIFDGIPVLFIPGNAGSHKQVRSYSSVALRKALHDVTGFHFDFFTVDLNKELSGLNGALLNEQTRYIQFCMYRILELYKNIDYPPKSVIVMGHSMGGIIARGLLKMQTSIPLLITLATPHNRPVLSLDSAIDEYYQEISDNTSRITNTSIVSISGGFDDFLVPPFTTYSEEFNNLHVMSTSVPRCWVSADHLCILWCKQLVLAVTRALFDSIDRSTKQLIEDPQLIHEIFHHHLVHHSGIEILQKRRYLLPISLSARNDRWIEVENRQDSIELPKGTRQTRWYMIPVGNCSKQDVLSVLAVNLDLTDWVFVCAGVNLHHEKSVCTNSYHLTHLSEIAPSSRYKRRTLTLKVNELKRNYSDATHVIVRITPTNEPVTIHVDIYNGTERKIMAQVPSFFSSQTVIKQTAEKALSYELYLPQLTHVMQFYKLYLTITRCKNAQNHATASLKVPWGHEDIHRFYSEIDKKPLDVRLYHSKPPKLNNSQQAAITLTLDPFCRYSVVMKYSFYGMLGQLTRTYSPLLIANIAAVILLTLRRQLIDVDREGNCSLFFLAMRTGIKPYYILTSVKLASRLLSLKQFSNIVKTDWEQIVKEGNDFFLLPLLLYMCSVGIVWLGAVGLTLSLIFCESTIHKFATKFLARTVTGIVKFSDWLIGGMHKLPGIVAVFLVVTSITSCGALSLCLGTLFYFLKLTQMSQDYIEELVLDIFKRVTKNVKGRYFTKKSSEKEETELKAIEQKTVDQIDIKEEEEESENVCDINQKEEESELDQEIIGCDNELIQEVIAEEICDKNEEQPEIEIPTYSSIFFHFTMFLMWLLVTLLNIPYVLTWAHNYKYNAMLQPDPSFLPGLILSFCALPLWHLDLPKPNRKWYMVLANVSNVLAGVCLIYGLHSIYRLNYILTATIAIVTLHQLFSPAKEGVGDVSDRNLSEGLHEAFDRMKTKWE